MRDDTGQPTAYLPPRGKRYPGAARRPLRWPGPGSVPLGDGCLDRLSAMLLGYAPRRAETITLAGLSALTGAPSDTPTPSRLLPGWHTLRRSVPSGGAFHPNEIYLAWAGSPTSRPASTTTTRRTTAWNCCARAARPPGSTGSSGSRRRPGTRCC